MAQQRAPIASHALDDVHVDLSPVRDRREPVEAPGAFPAPSTHLRSFMANPLPAQASGETILQGFASLRPAGKRERMVPYPIRLPAAQIAHLERLKEERGIIPAEFIRDAVASCLALLLQA